MIFQALQGMLLVPLIATTMAGSPQMEMDYEGDVDIYTGAPVEEENTENSGATTISLPDGGEYSRTDHTFAYMPSGLKDGVHSNVASGMITNDTVSLTVDEGFSVDVYKDGKILKNADLTKISEPGKYLVVHKTSDNKNQLMSFTIVSDATGAIDSYPLPVGFFIRQVTKDDKKQVLANTGSVDLSEDGKYRIDYRCQATSIDYSLNVTIDHKAPKFKLKGVKNGEARGPVTITDVKKDETMTVKKNGNELNLLMANTVKDIGEYEVSVADKAGNVTKKTFTIKMYLNYQSVIFFLLTIAVIAAAAIYMYLSRKKLRVR